MRNKELGRDRSEFSILPRDTNGWTIIKPVHKSNNNFSLFIVMADDYPAPCQIWLIFIMIFASSTKFYKVFFYIINFSFSLIKVLSAN